MPRSPPKKICVEGRYTTDAQQKIKRRNIAADVRGPEMGKVILLTGGPGTGKSTLRDAIATQVTGLEHFDYGQLLLRRKQKHGSDIAYEQLRQESARIISPEDVTSTDDWVVAEISRLRTASHVLIDSHALTRESYGFRAVAFSTRHLESLRLDAIIVLRCDPDVLIARTKQNPGGRRELTTELAREIQVLQEALSLTYAVVCGCPVFVIDTTELTAPDVANIALRNLEQVGVT
jgi:adenylate kinase